MVDKKRMVEYLTFADVHENLDDKGSEQLYDSLFNTADLEPDFGQPDYILLHGGPSEKKEKQRFRAFEDLLTDLNKDKLPYLLTTPSYRSKIEESDKVTENDFIYCPIRSESTFGEVNTLSEQIEPEETVISVTSDYHVPRLESMMNKLLEEDIDYLVVGQKYSSEEKNYRSKWRSEFISTVLPQNIKDVGKDIL